MANVNDGHRQRLRERMMREGLDGFKDHEVLELLLFQSVPRKDTNKLAHALIDRFGSLHNVLKADPDKLMMVNGVSEVTACNLSMLKEVWLRYKRGENERLDLSKMENVLKYARSLVSDSYTERMVVVYVDRGSKFLFRDEFVAAANEHVVEVDVKQIVSQAVRLKASGIALFHCHVEGDSYPSYDDVEFTKDLLCSLGGMEIVLLEHLVFTPSGEYFSFFENGVIDKMITELNEKK